MRIDRKIRILALDRIPNQDVEQCLVAEQFRVVGQWRRIETGKGQVITIEGPVRGQGQSRRDNLPTIEMLVIFKQADLSADPDHGGIPDCLVSLRYYEVPGAALRKVDVPHCFERYPNQEIHALRPGFEHGLNNDVRGDFVRGTTTR